MAWTLQEKVLNELQEKFGKSAFTEDHIHYRQVGFQRGRATIQAFGDTWEEAIEELERKAKA